MRASSAHTRAARIWTNRTVYVATYVSIYTRADESGNGNGNGKGNKNENENEKESEYENENEVVKVSEGRWKVTKKASR